MKKQYKVFKNSEGYFKIKIEDPLLGWRFVQDVDMMTVVDNNYVADDLVFYSKEALNEFIAAYLPLFQLKPKNDFEEIDYV